MNQTQSEETPGQTSGAAPSRKFKTFGEYKYPSVHPTVRPDPPDDPSDGDRALVDLHIRKGIFRLHEAKWPTQGRDGERGPVVSGYDGIRGARVLAGILLAAGRHNSLQFEINLQRFGIEVGICNPRSVRDALDDLHQAGLIIFTPGVRDRWSPGKRVLIPGMPSIVTLLPCEGDGVGFLDDIVDPGLDVFSTIQGSQGLGSTTTAWWIVSKIRWVYREDSVVTIRRSDLVKLASLSEKRVTAGVQVLIARGLARKVGRDYELNIEVIEDYLIESPDHHEVRDQRIQRHQDRLETRIFNDHKFLHNFPISEISSLSAM